MQLACMSKTGWIKLLVIISTIITNLFAETKAGISGSLHFLHCSSSFYSLFLHMCASFTMGNQCKKETEGQVIMCSHTWVVPPRRLIRRDHPGPGSQGRMCQAMLYPCWHQSDKISPFFTPCTSASHTKE